MTMTKHNRKAHTRTLSCGKTVAVKAAEVNYDITPDQWLKQYLPEVSDLLDRFTAGNTAYWLNYKAGSLTSKMRRDQEEIRREITATLRQHKPNWVSDFKAALPSYRLHLVDQYPANVTHDEWSQILRQESRNGMAA